MSSDEQPRMSSSPSRLLPRADEVNRDDPEFEKKLKQKLYAVELEIAKSADAWPLDQRVGYVEEALARIRGWEAAGILELECGPFETSFLETLSLLYGLQARLSKRKMVVERLLELYEQTRCRSKIIQALRTLLHVYAELFEPKKAIECFERVVKADPRGIQAVPNHYLSIAAREYSRIGEFEKAWDLLRKVSDSFPLALRTGSLLRQAEVAAMRRDFSQALSCAEQSLQNIQGSSERQITEAYAFQILGRLHTELKDFERAQEALDRSLEICRHLQNRIAEARTQVALGSLQAVVGEHRDAVNSFTQALQIVREAGELSCECEALKRLGDAHEALGETDLALKFFDDALQLSRSRGFRYIEAGALVSVGTVLFSHGKPADAVAPLRQASEIYRDTNQQFWEQHAQYHLRCALKAL